MNVYDFDNTIYHGESGLDMFWFYLKRKPSLLRFFPCVLRGFIDYKRHKIALHQVIERIGVPLRGFLESTQDLQADAKEFWDRHEHRIRPFYFMLRRPDDLIISAGPEQSLREVCGRIGVSRYIGTVINEATRSLDFVCFRENKARAFRERYPGERIENFYTDSYNDKPLMDIAEHVFMVRKGAIEQIK